MLKNKLTIVAAAALFTANLGLAGENTAVAPVAKAAENHFYASLEGGVVAAEMGSKWSDYINAKAKYLAEESGRTTHAEHRNFGIAGRLAVGYLMNVATNFNAGVETGFSLYQGPHFKINDSANKFEGTSYGYDIDLLGVAKYNFTNSFNVFGKAGAVYATQKSEGKIKGDFYNEELKGGKMSDHKFAPKAALGIGYNINQNFEVTLAYSHVFGKTWKESFLTSNKNNIISTDAILVGLTYNFV